MKDPPVVFDRLRFYAALLWPQGSFGLSLYKLCGCHRAAGSLYASTQRVAARRRIV